MGMKYSYFVVLFSVLFPNLGLVAQVGFSQMGAVLGVQFALMNCAIIMMVR